MRPLPAAPFVRRVGLAALLGLLASLMIGNLTAIASESRAQTFGERPAVVVAPLQDDVQSAVDRLVRNALEFL